MFHMAPIGLTIQLEGWMKIQTLRFMSFQTYSKDGTFSLNHKTCKCENNRSCKIDAELIYVKLGRCRY